MIRLACAPDLPAVLRCLRSLAEVDLDYDAARLVFQEQIRQGVRLYVVFDDDGSIAGTASLRFDRKFIHQGGLAARIEDVAVRHDCQGKGYGSELVIALKAEARKAGAYKVTLACRHGLRAWYERLGFKKHEDEMRIDL